MVLNPEPGLISRLELIAAKFLRILRVFLESLILVLVIIRRIIPRSVIGNQVIYDLFSLVSVAPAFPFITTLAIGWSKVILL
jgi:hypothetical protein